MYFDGLENVGQVKRVYRSLARQHHPDHGGETATMQAINGEYHDILESFHGQVSIGTDKKEHTYYYNREAEQEIMDKIAELLALRLPNIEIELIGTWIWVGGDTRLVKEDLKAAGLRWHGKREKWYWRRYRGRRKYNKHVTMEGLRQAYGAQSFEAENNGKGLQVTS